MARRKVLFVGNCQALALANCYRTYVGARQGDEVVYFDDFNVDAAVVRLSVEGAEVVVVQERDFGGTLTAGDLAPGVRFYTFPMLLVGFLWPFSNEPHIRNHALPPFTEGPYPTQLGDSFLNRLISKGVSPEDALQQYLDLDIAKATHIDRLMELYLGRQRSRDKKTGFETVSVVEAHLRDEQLFLTSQHPNARLFRAVAARLFEMMDVPPETIAHAMDCLRVSPFPPDEMPIHPGVIAHLGLEFANEHTRYSFHGEGRFTFSEFVLRYMRYANNHALRKGIFLAHSDPAAALESLDEGLRDSPKSTQGLLAKGLALSRLGKDKEALVPLLEAAALSPRDPEPLVLIAHLRGRTGALGEAEAIASRAVEIDPLHVPARQVMGETLYLTGRARAAAEMAREAARLRPGDPGSYRLLGAALLETGDLAGAKDAATIALTIAPDNADHRNLLATVREIQGDRADAIAVLDEGLARDCFDAHTFSLLGNFHMRNGDLTLSEAAFRRGLALDPNFAALVEQVVAMRARESVA